MSEEKFEEYKRTLLGKEITVKISQELDAKERTAILNQIDTAINKINDGAQEGLSERYTLDSEEVKGITSLNGLTVSNRVAWSHMEIGTGTFIMTPAFVLNGTNDSLTGSLVHDAYHKAQANSKQDYGGRKAEMAASSFALGVGLKLGLDEVTIQNLCRDVKFGHKAPPYNPYKKLGKKQ